MKISLKLNGQTLKTVDAEIGREYFAGRAEDCAFPLGDHRGISRQHLKFFHQNGAWYCESLSKFLHPKMGDENFETLELNGTVHFTLYPYEFEVLVESAENDEPVPEGVPVQNALVPSHHPPTEPKEDTDPHAMENTQVHPVALTPVLRVVYPLTGETELFSLEGQSWSAGRESESEIQLRDVKISRKHFEVNKANNGYFVTDLGSANGTYLNDEKLTPHEPTRLSSGDILRVLQIEIHFEIKTTNLPVLTAQPMAPFQAMMDPWGMGTPAAAEAASDGGKEKKKKLFMRVAIGAVAMIAVFFAIMEPDKKTESSDLASSVPGKSNNTTPAFDNLTPEQKAAVKDSLNLARNLYVQGKYSLCLAEIARLHEVVPFYDNSKELESFCIQGHELTQRKIDNDRKEAAKAMVEQKIADVTNMCRAKFKNSGEVGEIRACLADVIELNPEHPVIVELIQGAEDRVRNRELAAQLRADESRRRNSILSIFTKAKKLHQDGKLLKARSEYNKFIAAAPGSLADERSEAQRQVASISNSISTKVNFAMDKCKTLGEGGKYKEAYRACADALKEDPSLESAKELQERYASDLRRQLKTIYEDARLEESMGNVETAKEKWKKIREDDIPSGDFYEKATVKLKQYGAL